MKTLLLAGVGIVLLIGAVLLLRRRRSLRKQMLPSRTRTSAGEDRVQETSPPSPSPDQPGVVRVHGVSQSQTMGPQQRRQMLRYLKTSYDKGSQARLDAMEEMVSWGHPACLPLLRRGLRDADLRVVGLAARGLERFRGPRQRLKRLKHSPRRRHPSPPV